MSRWVVFDAPNAISVTGQRFQRDDGRVCILKQILPAPIRFETFCDDTVDHVFNGTDTLFPQKEDGAPTCLGCIASKK